MCIDASAGVGGSDKIMHKTGRTQCRSNASNSQCAREKLAALLDRPAGQPVAYALFAHCFTCGKDVLAAKRIAEGLTTRGIAVLRFDFTGLGASEGEFANTTFSSNVADLVAARRSSADEVQAPAILIGHSLGGAAVLAAAGRSRRRARSPRSRPRPIPPT